ncbi:peptidoglycan editing factor PgeF [Telluribacter sp. SYSU D00476]|uniref:peptidoglycan editing factor PgeF n=1 Tax=Telluribacter sp. SYSU D00476 TaxID=2811430 RepID=UPI001FF4C1AD|nr:peptidoglycan editing factor PgeF [Telluribacter sp. SYSU D00476]
MFRSPALFEQFPDVIAAESTRHGGVSPTPFFSLNLGQSTGDSATHIEENRRRFWQALGVSASQVAKSHQVHGSDILTVTQPGHYDGYDALVTNRANIVLTVTIADCTPVLLYDPVQRAVAAIHAGWRGTVQQITAKALMKMQDEYGTDPADCYAYIGTCIDECSFEVGEDVAGHFAEEHKRYDNGLQKYFVDLKATNLAQLRDAGIPEDQVEVSPYSTVLHNEDYFSYRLEKGQTGRLLAAIAICNR